MGVLASHFETQDMAHMATGVQDSCADSDLVFHKWLTVSVHARASWTPVVHPSVCVHAPESHQTPG